MTDIKKIFIKYDVQPLFWEKKVFIIYCMILSLTNEWAKNFYILILCYD